MMIVSQLVIPASEQLLYSQCWAQCFNLFHRAIPWSRIPFEPPPPISNGLMNQIVTQLDPRIINKAPRITLYPCNNGNARYPTAPSIHPSVPPYTLIPLPASVL